MRRRGVGDTQKRGGPSPGGVSQLITVTRGRYRGPEYTGYDRLDLSDYAAVLGGGVFNRELR